MLCFPQKAFMDKVKKAIADEKKEEKREKKEKKKQEQQQQEEEEEEREKKEQEQQQQEEEEDEEELSLMDKVKKTIADEKREKKEKKKQEQQQQEEEEDKKELSEHEDEESEHEIDEEEEEEGKEEEPAAKTAKVAISPRISPRKGQKQKKSGSIPCSCMPGKPSAKCYAAKCTANSIEVYMCVVHVSIRFILLPLTMLFYLCVSLCHVDVYVCRWSLNASV